MWQQRRGVLRQVRRLPAAQVRGAGGAVRRGCLGGWACRSPRALRRACWAAAAQRGAAPPCRPYCHEMALRILLASLEQHAARYKRYIRPVLSLSIDFYIRVFVRVHTSGERMRRAGGARQAGLTCRLGGRAPACRARTTLPRSAAACSGRGQEHSHASGLRVAEHRLRLVLLAARGAARDQGRRQRQVHGGCAAGACRLCVQCVRRGRCRAGGRPQSMACGRHACLACLPASPRAAGAGPAVPQQCPDTGSGFQMGGPFWAEPLHDPQWVEGLLQQVRRDKDM